MSQFYPRHPGKSKTVGRFPCKPLFLTWGGYETNEYSVVVRISILHASSAVDTRKGQEEIDRLEKASSTFTYLGISTVSVQGNALCSSVVMVYRGAVLPCDVTPWPERDTIIWSNEKLVKHTMNKIWATYGYVKRIKPSTMPHALRSSSVCFLLFEPGELRPDVPTATRQQD